MYDVRHNTEFLIGENPEQYHSYWWDDAEPLWITATKQVLEKQEAQLSLTNCPTLVHADVVQLVLPRAAVW